MFVRVRDALEAWGRKLSHSFVDRFFMIGRFYEDGVWLESVADPSMVLPYDVM